mmetsp:Transcript_91474/g.254764  ORF Transcript_91474/g.254764 Transcript_91474/m.254764 type:complete len:190 (+) Transcript_91474:3-572(+)
MTEATVVQARALLRELQIEAEGRLDLRWEKLSASEQEFVMWNMRAKLEARFAYMRGLLAIPAFVKMAEDELNRFDTNRNGTLNVDELESCVEEMIARHGWVAKDASQKAGKNVNKREITEIFFKRMDRNCNGFVSRAEFLAYLAYFHHECYEHKVEIPEIFEVQEGKRPASWRGRRRACGCFWCCCCCC